MSGLRDALERARAGGPARHHEKSEKQGKLPVRDRVARLIDRGSFVEDAVLANWEREGLGADGVVTGMGTTAGRPVCVMASDPTVKAGSWGPKTVEKIIRAQELALVQQVPVIYMVDSAGARITDRSTCCVWPPSSSWTRWSSRKTCEASWCDASPSIRGECGSGRPSTMRSRRYSVSSGG